MPYVKIWTTIYNKDWFVGMKINGRSIILQLYLLAKQYGDTGEITFSSWSHAAEILATTRSTLARSLSYLAKNGQLTYGKLQNGSVRITLIDYEMYQSLTAKEVHQRDKEKLSKSCQKSRLAEQSRAEHISSASKKSTRRKNVDNSPPDPHHKEFIDRWCKAYERKFKCKYTFSRGKDGTAVKRLLKAYGYERACEIASYYLNADDKFYDTVGRDLAKLFGESNKIQQKMAANPHWMYRDPMTAEQEQEYYERKRRSGANEDPVEIRKILQDRFGVDE